MMEMESDTEYKNLESLQGYLQPEGKWPVRKSDWHKNPVQQLADNPWEEQHSLKEVMESASCKNTLI